MMYLHRYLVDRVAAVLAAAAFSLPVAAQVCDSALSLDSFGIETGRGCWLYFDRVQAVGGQSVRDGEVIQFDGVGNGIACTPCDLGCGGTIDVTMSFGSTVVGGAAGIALGYCPGEAFASNPDYLVLLVDEAAGSPLRLLRITSPLAVDGSFQNPQLIAQSAAGHNGLLELSIGLTSGQLVVTDNGTTLIDESRDFSAYLGACTRVCFVAQRQDVKWFNLSVNPTVATDALWENYGDGTPGCFGVPTLGMVGPPRIGSTPMIAIGNRAFANREASMLWSLAPAQTFVPLLGGELLVQTPLVAVVTVDIPWGGRIIACTIDNDCSMIGQEFYLQVAMVDPCAASGYSLSRGMRILIGL